MKSIKSSLQESLLNTFDDLEKDADQQVLINHIYNELTTTYGKIVFPENGHIFRASDISVKGNEIILPNNLMIDFGVIPDIFKKYKLAPLNDLIILHYSGKVSKLPITFVNNLGFNSCKLEFDSKLKCQTVRFDMCSLDKKISNKQTFKTYTMDYGTMENITTLYMSQLAPNAESVF